jgi:hypothetical protein
MRMLYRGANLRHPAALAHVANEAVTLWRAHGKAHVGFMETLLSGLGYFQTFGTALGRGLAVSHAMESHHPRRIPKRKTAKIDDHHGVIEWSV